MSIAGDEYTLTSEDSFWQVDGYRKTVKRCEDGQMLAGELMKLIQDRADLEKEYVRGLKKWSTKFQETIRKGPEYGTMEQSTLGLLTEADRVADIHSEVKDKLLTDVQASIKQWRAENYHKVTMGRQLKETKQFDEDFKKAQKPWAKKYGKVEKAKKDYYSACKQEKSALNQETNARNDGSTAEQLRKLQDKTEKCKRDVIKTKELYENSLDDLNNYNAKYMEEMTEVFNRTQEFEGRRMKFFKEMLFGIHQCLDLASNYPLTEMYQKSHQRIEQADCDTDLRFWSENHGVDMGMTWPVFQEYSTELRTIHKKEKKIAGTDGITLTHVKHNDAVETNNTHTPPPTKPRLSVLERQISYDPNLNPFAGDGSDLPELEEEEDLRTAACASRAKPSRVTETSSTPSPAASHSANQHQNPFGEEWADDPYRHSEENNRHSSTSNGGGGSSASEGVPVRALYEYEAAEEDELAFKIGEVFLKTRDSDDQGWCEGLKDGRRGLYPDNYVEVIQQ